MAESLRSLVGGRLKVPTTIYVNTTVANQISTVINDTFSGFDYSRLTSTTANTWQTLATDTSGPGIITFMAVAIPTMVSGTVSMRLVLDGNIVWTVSNMWGSTDANKCVTIIGDIAGDLFGIYAVARGKIPYNSSFLLEAEKSTVGQTVYDTAWSYYRTK